MRTFVICALTVLLGQSNIQLAHAKTPDRTTYYAIKTLMAQRVRFDFQDESAQDRVSCPRRRLDCEAVLTFPRGGGPYCKGANASSSECTSRRRGGYIFLNCGGQTWLPASAPKEERSDATTAYYALFAERVMTAAGYPPGVWRPMLKEWELSARAEPETMLNDLTAAAGKYRRSHASLPYLTRKTFSPSEGGCGAGDSFVKVSAQPSNARIFIIPTFFYELCRAKGQNPEDTTRCVYWREVLRPVESIAGDYRYRVRWHDGTTREGTLDSSPDKDSVVIKKP